MDKVKEVLQYHWKWLIVAIICTIATYVDLFILYGKIDPYFCEFAIPMAILCGYILSMYLWINLDKKEV
jgi:hypothetical protein